jgi:CHAT domain-containing protein/Tfp pilus assembly protein PilF
MLSVIRKRSCCRPHSRAYGSSLISDLGFRCASRQSLRYRLLRRLVLLTLCLFALLITQSTSFAQTPTPTPSSPEAARVDQLITECRQLMAKGTFEGITEKGEEALTLSQNIDDKLRQSRSLMYIALGRFHTGRLDEAIEPFKQSAALAAEAGDVRQQALSLRSAGVLMVEAGQFDDALYFYNQALTLQRAQKNRAAEASLLGNIGRVYTDIHDYVKADKILLEALGMSRELHDELVEFSTLGKLVNLELSRSNYLQAVNYADDALNLTSSEIRDSLKNEVRLDLALAHFESGNKQKALELLEEVLAFERKTKIAFAEGETLGALAHVQLEMGRLNEALASATEALTLLRRAGADPSVQASVLYTQAQAQRRLGHNDEALANLRSAISLIERARLLSVSTEVSRAEFFASKGDIYLTTIDLLAAQGKSNEALAVAESYRGRAFLDSLAESRAELRKALPRDLLAKEDAILDRISDVQRQLWQENLSPERDQQLKRDLAAAEESLEQFQLEVRRTNPLYASVKHPQPFSTERLQRELLDPQTGLIEYVLGTEKSFAWLVLKDKIFFAPLPSEKELSRQVSEYRQALSERSNAKTTARSIAKLNAIGAQLYKILVEPFQRNLSGTRRLLIVPDKALAYLPFETLVAGRGRSRNEYLVEQFAIVYGPSASALAAVAQLQKPAATPSLVAFGDPIYDAADLEPQRSPASNSPTAKFASERGLDLRRLPYTRTEVTNIGALFTDPQRKLFLGAEANEPNVKSAPLLNYRYVHFAAHGFVDEDVPSRSGLFLSMVGTEKEDGILQMSEIMRLNLNADLVTLSACRTGLGRVVGGEGVLGLTRAFMYAGSRSVVASLWNVNDTATAELMKSFYANLKRGLPKDEALRQAKLGLIRGKQTIWRHPYYWGPFVLSGANK